MNILIVENVWMNQDKYGFFDKTFLTMFTVLPTLYARYVFAMTPKKHNVKIINERYEKTDFDEQLDIVHINFTTSTTRRAYEIADEFKRRGVTVVLSGLHASALPDGAIKHADSVLLGPVETNWLKLLEDFEEKKLKPFYPPVENNGEPLRIPPADISLPGFVLTGAVEATRGCPYRCSFCRETNIPGGSNFLMRPVEDVVKEIESMPQKAFTFYDTSLTINPGYTKELFKKMRGLGKKFSCNGNVDVLANDLELVKLSKEAGCVSWLIGFESVSQKTLEAIGKKTNRVENYLKAVKNIHDNKMAVIGYFVLGFDTDDKNVFSETLETVEKIGVDSADFLVLTPFPGTPLYEKYVRENRVLTRRWEKYNMRNVVFKPKNMTPGELLIGVQKTHREFYSFNNVVKRTIKSIKLGFYPFFIVLERNFLAHMNMRNLFSQTKKRGSEDL